jgi:hypothetical protein
MAHSLACPRPRTSCDEPVFGQTMPPPLLAPGREVLPPSPRSVLEKPLLVGCAPAPHATRVWSVKPMPSVQLCHRGVEHGLRNWLQRLRRLPHVHMQSSGCLIAHPNGEETAGMVYEDFEFMGCVVAASTSKNCLRQRGLQGLSMSVNVRRHAKHAWARFQTMRPRVHRQIAIWEIAPKRHCARMR